MELGLEKNEYFWRRVNPHKNPFRIFNTPEEMWEKAVEAFDWMHEHPLLEEVVFCSKGEILRTEVSKRRAFTKHQVALQMGLTLSTLSDYARKHGEAFQPVLDMIDAVIYTQKFEGAAAGLLNANIVGNDLGLKSQVDTTVHGPDGGPIEMIERVIVDTCPKLLEKLE